MKYSNIIEGKFISRPNRFIAYVEINGTAEVSHVKNTGRCKELLSKDARVYLEVSDNPERKTKYDLISVYKGDTLVNMDSQAPNKVALEFIREKLPNAKIKPEYTYGNSRIDIYVENGDKKALIEVKGVTLENNGIAMFPDAPTERGIKHINELIKAKEDGFESYILFVIQMKGVSEFKPNYKTHREFGKALQKAQKAGVKILAYDCIVTENTLKIDAPVSVNLENED
ncbi:MAG: DNA/RNA nuclease SfsA [Clostridia bacterium]|nr:DNA/RNA nuclease SfsA [Clostridia bacterium]